MSDGFSWFDLEDIPMPNDPLGPIAKTFEGSDPLREGAVCAFPSRAQAQGG